MQQSDDSFVPGLLVVDVQEDFCPPTGDKDLLISGQNGSLAVPAGRDVIKVINQLLDLPFVVKVATKDWHPPTHVSFAANHPAPNNVPFDSFAPIQNPLHPAETQQIRLWPIHCVQGTPGAELIPELNIQQIDHIIEKGQDERVEMYSAFADCFKDVHVSTSGLLPLLLESGVTHLFVVGLAMDYCVKCSATDAAKHGFKTFVIREGTRAVQSDHKSLQQVEAELGDAHVALINLDDPEVDRVRR
ncbi:MAG: NAD(+) salvage pathway protein [Caeruleum heppii]|nr:MAG: NAD(+) salvage pathway protein [Caeruleum heppii]